MPIWIATLLSIIGSILASWAGKLMSRTFLEWALLKLGRMVVGHTKTTADDDWFNKFEEVVKGGTQEAKASDNTTP